MHNFISRSQKLKIHEKFKVADVLARFSSLTICDIASKKRFSHRIVNNSKPRLTRRFNSTHEPKSLKNLKDVAEFIKEPNTKNVVVAAGAGISTASGIPDFRTPGTGLYDNLQKYNLPYPEAIFDMDFLMMDAHPFFTLAKDLYPGEKYEPNNVHLFIKLLSDKGKLLKMFTQNIDGLERAAGIPPEKLIEAHGTLSTATCVSCNRKYKITENKDDIFNGVIPKCRQVKCKGIIKPDIVFFGEQLPANFWTYTEIMPAADLLIVMGTSLEVQPFAGIVDFIKSDVPRLLINRDMVGAFSNDCQSDIVIIGDLTEEVCKLVNYLGWMDDLQRLKKLYSK
ncbi:Sirt2 (predicted) [Pycnogonum litorale]